MGFLRQWVFHNAGLKLLALALSFLLWSSYQAEPMAEMGYTVPLEFVNIPTNLEISGDVSPNEIPAQVRLRVRGRSALLRQLTAGDLALRVNLSGAKPGKMLIPLSPDQAAVPHGATIVRISPTQVHIMLLARGPAS